MSDLQRPRRGRQLGGAVVSAALLAASACYEYRPLDSGNAPVGEPVSLQITDQGRVRLSERFGPGLAEIRGRLVSHENNEYVVNVDRVSQISGASAAWSGEETRVDRSLVGTVKGRQLSPTRTALMSIAAAGVAYFVISQGLTGSYTQPPDDPVVDPPLSIRRQPLRIPLGFRF